MARGRLGADPPTLIPNQVPREDLLNAFTLSAATRHGAKLILIVVSPLLAVGFVSIEGVLVLSAFLQLIGAVLMSRTRTVSRGESAPEHGLARSIVDGLVHIYTNRTIALFIVLVAFHCALVMSFDSILPVLSREELGATDASVYGYLVVAFGAGSVIGLLLIAGIRDDARKGQVLMWTAVASGLTPISLAVSGNVPLAIVASAAMGASQATFMALTNTYAQTIAPDRLRGRIASLYTLHAGGIMAFSNLGYGFMADVFSAPRVLFVTGALFVVFLVALSAGQPALPEGLSDRRGGGGVSRGIRQPQRAERARPSTSSGRACRGYYPLMLSPSAGSGQACRTISAFSALKSYRGHR